MPSPQFVQQHRPDAQALAAEAAAGLQAVPARVSPKFFYDLLGSRLFDAITELPEYYPTRTEAAILQAHGGAIADAALGATGLHPVLVDLGAGNGAKAARLFPVLQPSRYVAVDISTDFLRQSIGALGREHPDLPMAGLGVDFSTRLEVPAEWLDRPALVFFPGSSIGNFALDDARRLLREARATAGGGALLIGVDLVKPTPVLEAAYDDELGVTAAFNLNLLRNLNRLLGADFQLRDWRHVAFFDTEASRIEMHLEARRELRVTWSTGSRRFATGERIHTENSAKWTPEAFEALLRSAGYGAVRCWTDPQRWFAVFLATL